MEPAAGDGEQGFFVDGRRSLAAQASFEVAKPGRRSGFPEGAKLVLDPSPAKPRREVDPRRRVGQEADYRTLPIPSFPGEAENGDHGVRRPELSEIGQEKAKTIASGNLRIAVGGVIDPSLAPGDQGFAQSGPAKAEERATDFHLVPQSPSFWNPRQPPKACAAKDAEEHGLGEVVSVVGRHQNAFPTLLAGPLKSPVPSFSQGILGFPLRLGRQQGDGESQIPVKRGRRFCILPGIRPVTVVDDQRAGGKILPLGPLLPRQGEKGGVRSSRTGQPYAGSRRPRTEGCEAGFWEGDHALRMPAPRHRRAPSKPFS